MWLYIPNTSTSSASAQGGVDSISGSNSLCQRFEASLWWRGKPSPSRTWSTRLSKVSWLQQLSGRMPDPSTAAHGAASWMASLAASRASHTQWPAGSADRSIPAIFGRPLGASSFKPGHGSSSSRMSPECLRRGLTKSLAPSASFETYADLVSRLRLDCSLRRRSAPATSGNASSSSAWPTPSVMLTGERTSPQAFEARRLRLKAKHGSRTGNGAGPDLAMIAKQWPTPTAVIHRSVYASEETHCRNARPLQEFVGLWATPTSSENSNRTTQMAPSHGNGHGIVLAGQAADFSKRWATPRSHEVGQYQNSKGNKSKPVSTLTGQALSLPDRPISTVGEEFSHIRRTLNPLFVEWLMGWPPGWTSVGLTPPASTVFACSATALSVWKQRMRSALLSLGSPIKAPPAQLSFVI